MEKTDIMMGNYDKIQSDAISFMRIPLAILVVLFHASLIFEQRNGIPYIDELNTPIYCMMDFLFGQSICALAVPLFFFVSGLLFFWNVDGFNIKVYGNKLKSRFYSLLIPYLFWNLLILLHRFIVQQYFPAFISPQYKLIADYHLTDFLSSFWNMSYVDSFWGNFPINGPLWFIRDLMIMNLLSPIVYYVMSCFKKYGAIVLFLLWLFDVLGGLGNFSKAILFYSLGAYFGIMKTNILEKTAKCCKVFLSGYLLLLILAVVFRSSNILFLNKIEFVFGFVSMWWLAVLFSQKYPSLKLPAGASFFLFAAHHTIVRIIIKIFFVLTPIHSDWIYVLAYFVITAITVLICLAFYGLLNRFTPKFCKIISGGR